MPSHRSTIISILALFTMLVQPAFAVVQRGETCASGPAYVFYGAQGSGLTQKAVCGTGGTRPPAPAGYSRTACSTCSSNGWQNNALVNQGADECSEPTLLAAGCPPGYLYSNDDADDLPATCTASSCTAFGTCASSCSSAGGTVVNNQCTQISFCQIDSNCIEPYQTCSTTTGRCGIECGTIELDSGAVVGGFCYGSDYCVGGNSCATCPGTLRADGTCPNFTPTASKVAEARRKKRRLAYLQSLLLNPDCPENMTSCPIVGSRGAYECLDTTQELTSCGGCSSLGAGEDCSVMPGVSRLGGATCVAGKCEARACIKGFQLFDGRCI